MATRAFSKVFYPFNTRMDVRDVYDHTIIKAMANTLHMASAITDSNNVKPLHWPFN
jgi:hypothetical protein